MKFKKNQIIKTNKVRVPRAYVSWLNNQVMRIICLCLKLNTSIKELRQSSWSWSWRSCNNGEETGIETKRTFWTIEVGLASNHSWDHSRQNSCMAKKFRNCPVKMRISKWWECTAILYSRFNWENAHFITQLSYSKQNTYGTWGSIWKITKSILIQTWTDTKVLLGNITTEFNVQFAQWHQKKGQQSNIIHTFTNIMQLTKQVHIFPFKCQIKNVCTIAHSIVWIKLSSSHDPRQRLQNLGHARSDNSHNTRVLLK